MLRKLRGEKSPTPNISVAPKSDLALTAPKCIIRALYPYVPQNNDELSFNKNDFFYVNEEPIPDWYLAANPLTGSKGLVPKAYFEVIKRQDHESVPVSHALKTRSQHSAHSSVSSEVSKHKRVGSRTSSGSHKSALYIYGFMLYDFSAERSDELSLEAGESIVITAQSNEEWFVAKPIGRLGGPGLVPISYVELREVGTDRPLTDVEDTIKRAGIPQVDEWKRKLAEYKASSIALDKQPKRATAQQPTVSPSQIHHRTLSATLAAQNQQNASKPNQTGNYPGQRQHSQFQPQVYHQAPAPKPVRTDQQMQFGQNPSVQTLNSSQTSTHSYKNSQSSADHSRQVSQTSAYRSVDNGEAYVLKASVDRFAIDGSRYWYLIKAEMSNGKYRNLCRYYQDFYDFQVTLLEKFPEEAGRTGKARSLPFMPGPLTLATDTINSQRRASLDDYIHDLIKMPPHVSRSAHILQLFEVRDGDIESNGPTDELPHPKLEPQQDSTSTGYSGDLPQETVDSLQYMNYADNATSFSDTQDNTADQTEPEPESEPAPEVKIKIYFEQTVVAMKVPINISLEEITAKISARLNTQISRICAEPNFMAPIESQVMFTQLLQRPKIALYVQ